MRGVAVLLPDSAQVALFLLADNSIRAVGNIDPIGRAAVMSRGIVGDRGGVPVVQSPLKKQAFSLRDGRCLDAEEVSLPVYATRIGCGRNRVGGQLPRDPVRLPSRRAFGLTRD